MSITAAPTPPARPTATAPTLSSLAGLPSRPHLQRLLESFPSKSVHSRDVTIPIEALKALDGYLNDHRQGETAEDSPLFTDRHGEPLTGNAVRKLFERLKVRTGIRDLCAHMLRHTWATNFHRSGSGSRFDLMVEGGARAARRCGSTSAVISPRSSGPP